MQYVLQRLFQAIFQFQDIILFQAWAIYDPRDHFMRPADTYRSINSYRESSRRLFFALPASAALILAVVYDIEYDLCNNSACQRQILYYPTYGPPTRKAAHP